MKEMTNIRKDIARKVRELRIGRHMTQAQLSELLGLSQARLSEIERGDGSFSAEQLLVMLRVFNVTVNHFAPPQRDAKIDSSAQAHLQNALARLGAMHLQEAADVLPTERLADVNDVIRETLLDGAPRQLTALAPVLVTHIRKISLRTLWASLVPLGLERRFGWVLENTMSAALMELERPVRRPVALGYRRAIVVLDTFLSSVRGAAHAERDVPPDLLDETARSAETHRALVAASSAISKRWQIVTDLQPEDFAEALRAARD